MSDPIFQRGLQDLIKGIRSHKKDPSAFISQAMASIKIELRSTDPFLKTEAIRKLTYLQMIGYNVSWAAFSIVEVMSQTRFAHKRVGYLAANQSFTESTDVILLTTNLFKKEFSSASNNQYEIGMAINCLANIATKDLARDCISDLVVLMNHSRAYVRKKAVLAMFKLYVKFPQGLRLTFDKLKDRLDDTESSVISTAVNVICELANKNPRNYLAMAPKFFRLLTTSSNNWMLIKVVKLLGSLVSEEPRLARKLLEPLSTIIQNTCAKSLQYECIHTVTLALPFTKRDDGSDSKNAPAVVKLCSDYLRGFIEDQDQNLKYLGLVGLVDLMKSNPRSVCDHREIVLSCLTDDDITIRTRALELLAGIVSRKSLVDLVHHLLMHVKHSEGSYRDEIIAKVLYMCSKEKFGLVTDFAWYASVLLDLAVMQGSKHGQEVADQLIEISLRVDTVRPFAVESMLSMLLTDTLILGQARQTVSEVLKAAAWIVGEYSEIVSLIAHDTADVSDSPGDSGYWIEGPTGEDIRSSWRGQPVHVLVVDALLHPRATNLPPHVQSAYIQSAMKVFVRACTDCTDGEIASLVGIARSRLGVFLQSVNSEVQERASTLRYLLAEMEILPMSWENQAEEIKPGEKPAGAKGAKKGEIKAAIKEMNLLDEVDDLLDMPEYTIQSVKAVDDQGACVAKRKARVLAAAVGEAFYAVHSKAQKRVPVPEGLDLEAPFNAAAISKLLSMQVPENLTLATLAFAIALPVTHMEHYNDNDEETRLSRLLSNTFPGEDPFKGTGGAYPSISNDVSSSSISGNKGGFPPPDNLTGIPNNHPGRSAEDNLFYLNSGSRAKDILPLSQVLADAFEDKKVKKVKGAKKEKRKKTDFNMKDMLPAGAVSSDDDKVRSRKTKSSSIRKKGEDLDSVDITTPLRADEVFTVHKHREVPVSVSSAFSDVIEDAPEEGKKKKSSKKQKDLLEDEIKKGKKDKDKSKKSKSKSEPADDLLMMDWNDPPMPSMPVVVASRPITVAADVTPDKKEKDKESKGKKSSHLWLPLLNDKTVDIYYATSVQSNIVTITLKAVNSSKTGSSVSVTATFNSSAGVRPATPSNSNLRLAQQLPPGSDCSAATELVILGDGVLTSNLQVGCTTHVTVESFLGPESKSTTVGLVVPVCSSFSPCKLDEKGFTALMSKSSSRWSSSTAKVSCASTKPKSALKAVGNFLRAHTVEAENTKAVSLSAKSASGGSVCCLAKISKDGTSVTVDIKCLCASKAESISLAEAITEALNDLSL